MVCSCTFSRLNDFPILREKSGVCRSACVDERFFHCQSVTFNTKSPLHTNPVRWNITPSHQQLQKWWIIICVKTAFSCQLWSKHKWWNLETWSRSRDASRYPFFEVSDLEGFRSRSRALRLETLHRLFFIMFFKEFLWNTVLKNNCSKFSRSKRSVTKLSLLLCCLRDEENNLPSTLLKFTLHSIKKNNETEARNFCSERLGVLC